MAFLCKSFRQLMAVSFRSADVRREVWANLQNSQCCTPARSLAKANAAVLARTCFNWYACSTPPCVYGTYRNTPMCASWWTSRKPEGTEGSPYQPKLSTHHIVYIVWYPLLRVDVSSCWSVKPDWNPIIVWFPR